VNIATNQHEVKVGNLGVVGYDILDMEWIKKVVKIINHVLFECACLWRSAHFFCGFIWQFQNFYYIKNNVYILNLRAEEFILL
jgi:hypothetical protein